MTTKKMGIILAVIILAGIAWFVYAQYGKKAAMMESTQMFSASFSCEDDTYFIAEFPTANSLNVVVDGTVLRTLARVEGDGQRYESDTHVYVFAGEEAVVTTKSTNTSTTCSQPVDPNNAPVNFGDAGEGDGTRPDVSLVVSDSIVGTWQSNEDAQSQREFKSDGSIVESYNGEVVTTGTWKVYTAENALPVSFPLESDAVYLQISDSVDLNFKVTKMTPEELELIYLDRGGVLTYTRVQ